MTNYQPNIILAAAQYAREAHEGQFRKYGNPPDKYIVHPMRVAGRVSLVPGVNAEMVAAAWLHDVIENCNKSYDDVYNTFGKYIADMVMGLTNPSEFYGYLKEKPRAERKKTDLDHIIAQTKDVHILKLGDIWDNLRDIEGAPEGFAWKYIKEKRLVVRAIAGSCRELSDENLAVISKYYAQGINKVPVYK